MKIAIYTAQRLEYVLKKHKPLQDEIFPVDFEQLCRDFAENSLQVECFENQFYPGNELAEKFVTWPEYYWRELTSGSRDFRLERSEISIKNKIVCPFCVSFP